jgi:hypothetical protein
MKNQENKYPGVNQLRTIGYETKYMDYHSGRLWAKTFHAYHDRKWQVSGDFNYEAAFISAKESVRHRFIGMTDKMLIQYRDKFSWWLQNTEEYPAYKEYIRFVISVIDYHIALRK